MESQKNLIDIYVDRLLKKHDVESQKADFSEEERERLREIIKNIETDVSKFLEQAEKKTTEHDMPQEMQGQTYTGVESTTEDVEPERTVTVEPPKTKPVIFLNNTKKKKK